MSTYLPTHPTKQRQVAHAPISHAQVAPCTLPPWSNNAQSNKKTHIATYEETVRPAAKFLHLYQFYLSGSGPLCSPNQLWKGENKSERRGHFPNRNPPPSSSSDINNGIPPVSLMTGTSVLNVGDGCRLRLTYMSIVEFIYWEKFQLSNANSKHPERLRKKKDFFRVYSSNQPFNMHLARGKVKYCRSYEPAYSSIVQKFQREFPRRALLRIVSKGIDSRELHWENELLY